VRRACRRVMLRSAPTAAASRGWPRILRPHPGAAAAPLSYSWAAADPARSCALALLGPALLPPLASPAASPSQCSARRLTAHAARFLPQGRSRTAAFLGRKWPTCPSLMRICCPCAQPADPRYDGRQSSCLGSNGLEGRVRSPSSAAGAGGPALGRPPSVNFVDAALRVLPEKPFMVWPWRGPRWTGVSWRVERAQPHESTGAAVRLERGQP